VPIERPSKPPPRDRRLTREEGKRLLNTADQPHIALAIALMLGPANRKRPVNRAFRWFGGGVNLGA
jgi:hypothetical protein